MPITEVKVINVFVDQKNNVPIVLLQNVEDNNTLPILIAPLEASMIAIELENQKPVRPLTHDLIVNILDRISYRVKSILIHDLKDNIYYAKINLVSIDNRTVEIDSRPSDAIAIALRTKSPIFVDKKLFGLNLSLEKAVDEVDEETLKQLLEKIEIDDVGGKIM